MWQPYGMMTIPQYIKAEGLQKQAFADAIGISRQALHMLIKKRCKPSLKTAFAIQKVTGGKITAEQLVGK